MTCHLDLALVNGRVRTLGPERPRASAVGVRDGRVVVVGDDAVVRAEADSTTQVIDLKGATVLPGIVDSHLHPFHGALKARGADLTDARTLDEVRRRVAEERARCAPDQWVLGFGLAYDVFEHTGISGDLIAEAAGDGPALLTFVDFHTELATPRALELAGVDGPRRFGEHSEIVVDERGVPTGELREMGAIRLVREAIPPLTPAERYRLCADQLRAFAAVGITGAHGMDGKPETRDLLRELEASGDLATRMVVPYWVHPDTPEEVWESYARHRDEGGERWRGGVVKLFIDGVIDSGTGWLFEPDSEGAGLTPLWPDFDRYVRAVEFFASHGFQIATHATGDRGVHEALNTYKAAGAAPGVRHRIEHIETLRPEDLPRFAAEGVIASMQAQHMMWLEPDRSDNWSRRLGAERCDRAMPVRALHASGAVVTLGSDWPVASYDWREGMAAAQLRRPPGHPERAPYDDQGIDALTALHGYTSRPALTTGDHDRLGALEPGYLADITVLAEDPVVLAPDDLVHNPVMLTVVDGEVVHRAADLDG
ncbi:amidohydrolase [Streptomyces spongiae]|uniref:Amidohydrolase family protein n=1 Tax=Streptomyces spongiae TaxID=565072 RepID=A0A5N8XAS6_9ACTN|nr:amidohydrolase [Streptomyces spongiae]MPY56552.1 amidohydrolase family protein [Streptomyces spongiae]